MKMMMVYGGNGGLGCPGWVEWKRVCPGRELRELPILTHWKGFGGCCPFPLVPWGFSTVPQELLNC